MTHQRKRTPLRSILRAVRFPFFAPSLPEGRYNKGAI